MASEAKAHSYSIHVEWAGDQGSGTSGHRAYLRDHIITAGSKPAIAGSSDPEFRGDAAMWNPEDLLVASISACHKLWYLHLSVDAGITVLAYVDDPVGRTVEDRTTSGRFTGVTLHPKVTIGFGDDRLIAMELHRKAHRMCFIANSVNFPITCQASIRNLGDE
ncbi:OsmC family protein [Phenylobacterium sp.]|uniref:OsmC family protein n=1 Tax=Phenylobacterium sp. TaxID=1871053 RepID=UPI003BAC1A18